MRKSQEYQIKGSFNYHVDFQIKGQSPFQSCILVVNVFSKSDKKYAIASKCLWSRIRGSRTYTLLGINSNTYQLSAQDIGSTIEIEVLPQEEGFKGSAIIHFGPVVLEPNIKATLEGILAAGGSKFPLNLLKEDTGQTLKDNAALLLTNEYVRLVVNVNDREERSLKFRYNLEEPEIEMNNLDTTLLALNFKGVFEEDMPTIIRFIHENRLNPSKMCRLSVRTISKTSRDLIYLALKCFAAKSFLIDSKLISSIDSLFSEGKLFSNKVNKAGTFGDILLEVEGLKKEISFLLKSNQEITSEKESYLNEIKSLEKEISDTIEAYSQMIMEFKTPGGNYHNESMMLEMSMMGKKDEIYYRNEVKKLSEDKKKLIEKIAMMTEELELNRHFNKNDGYFSESRIWTKHDELVTNNRESRVLGSPVTSNRELEVALMNVSELKTRNAMLEKQLAEYVSEAGSRKESGNMKILEQKLQETKKLNEMLLTELNERRQKEHFTDNLANNNNISQQLLKKSAEVSQIETEKNIIMKEHEILKVKLATVEAELQEARKKNSFLENQNINRNLNSSTSEIYARFEQERNSLNNEMFSLRAKSNKLELDNSELLRKVENLESQLRAIRSKCETLEFEGQVLRKENDGLKIQGRSSIPDDRSEKLKAAEARLFEMKSKHDLLLAENEQLKFRISEAGNRSFSIDFINKEEKMKAENLMEQKIKSLQKLLEEGRSVNEKNLKEINIVKRENMELRNEVEMLRRGNVERGYNTQKLNDTSFMLNRTVTYELESENESLKNKLSSLELMLSEYKTKFSILQTEKLHEEGRGVNEKNLKEINILKRENMELRNEVEMLRRGNVERGYNTQKLNDTSFMLNRTATYELESENESLKNKLSSLELMLAEYKTKFSILQTECEGLRKGREISGNSSTEIEVLKSRIATNELLIGDYKIKLENAHLEVNSLRNENELLKSEIEELSKQKAKVNVSTNEVLNRSFRDTSSLNRTFQIELEMENDNLKKNMASLETMLQDYKNSLKVSYEKIQAIEKKNNDLVFELQSGKISTNDASLLENLKTTNQRLMAENNKLMEMLRKSQDENDGLKSRSRIVDASFMGDNDVFSLREKVAELQRENEAINNEKDKLLVELSKLMAQNF